MTTRQGKSVTRMLLEKHAGGPLNLGMLVRAIREGEDYSLAEMGSKLRVTRAHVAAIEKGKPVSPEAAARYARALGYSEQQFVRLALQDQIRRTGLKYEVDVKPNLRAAG